MDHIGKVLVFVTLLSSLLEMCSSYGYIHTMYARDSYPVVATCSGSIRGKQMNAEGSDIVAFLGIPYAEPPVGELRFKKPVPKRSWSGVYDATKKAPPCMQYTNMENFQWISKATPSEDCLYLNIWVPGKMNFELEPRGKPVMLWIHGGGYFAGSSEMDIYDGATLAGQGNVVVVSLNYRLGAFGFLTSGTKEAPGNMGMHDQHVAIEWVRNNIRQFKGDPDKITLFGESAGAVSAGLHLISPLSRNYFRRAIMQSGSPYHPLLAVNPSIMVTVSNVYATAVGCADDKLSIFTDHKKVIECLKKIDPLQLAIAESFMREKAPYAFLPIHGDDFMPVDPITAMNNGYFKCTEVLIGSNSDEGSVLLHYLLPDLLGLELTPNLSLEQAQMVIAGIFQNSTNPPAQAIADFYLKDASNSDPAAILKAVHDSYGDYIINCPSVLFAEKFSKAGVSFYYYFTHRPSNSIWANWMGTAHFDEVFFVFGDPIRNATLYTPEERLFSRSIIQRWTTFARFGVPTVSKTEGWPKFTKDNPLSLELNPRSHKIGEAPYNKVCEFWRSYLVPSE